DPDRAAGALHELVRAAWENAGRATNPEVVEKTGMGLSALSKRDLLPETRLLLALFPDRARAVERRSGEDVATRIRERLAGIAFGAPVEEQGLTIFPLLAPNGSSPPAVPLSQAIDEGWAEISEVSEEGEIPSLLIDNRGRTPVIVIEGEIFTGLKQDRVVNLTLVAAAGSRSTLPVSCVEQGRWRRSGAGIRSSSYASPRIRAYKTRSVYRRRAVSGTTSSDQAGIWRQVEAQLMGAGASSPTGTLAAAYEASEKRLESLRDALPYPQGACGFLAAQGEQILGLDLFDSPETLERVWRRLADGYFLEALTRAEAAGPIDEAAAARFLEKAAQGLRPSSRQLGAGLELEISGDGIVGSVCWFGGTLCHLSAHPIEEDRR
ncbi:MAG: ARPP-1 family domain-containing protein, partial [Planctomycetota bacterium]